MPKKLFQLQNPRKMPLKKFFVSKVCILKAEIHLYLGKIRIKHSRKQCNLIDIRALIISSIIFPRFVDY